MSIFEIKTEDAKKGSEQIKLIAHHMSIYCDELIRVSSQVRSMGGTYEKVGDALDEIIKQLERNSKNVDNLGASLETIVQIYLITEKSIASVGGRSINSRKSRTVSDLKPDNNYNESVWGNDNKYVYTTAAGSYWVFHYGTQNPSRPDFDNGYPYDPDMKPTISDYLNWMKWGLISEGADFLDYLPDGVRAYEHYRNGNGSALEIDFAKGYRQDPVIRANTDRTVAETNRAVQQMIAEGAQPPFTITSECMSAGGYPSTENWQKTIGGYQVWVSADVSYDEHGNVVVNTTVHEWDRYNFNNGEYDITTGEPDDVNGRFEALGWAHSFDTYGSVKFKTVFKPDGNIGVPAITTSEGRNRVGYERRTYR